MEVLMLFAAAAAILLFGLPARIVGRRIHAAGIRENVKWKRDLGAAVHAHGFRLTVALVVLAVVVVPNLVSGKGWFGGI